MKERFGPSLFDLDQLYGCENDCLIYRMKLFCNILHLFAILFI